MDVTRRSVVRTALAMPLVAAGGRAVYAGIGRRIIVVGAGLAGLTAARELKRRGADVVVVEARDRIGGRIWTSRVWPDLPMDLGASWIHGVDGNPLTELANLAGAKRLRTSYESSETFDVDGRAIDSDTATKNAHAVVRAARQEAEEAERDHSLAEAIQNSQRWHSADDALRRMIRHVVNSTVEHEYGGDWTEVSAWYHDDVREFAGGDELFPQGFDQVTSWLARDLDIRLNRAVGSIARTARGVRVAFADGTTEDADHVVVTLPIGVLQSGKVTFGEPLAPERQRAIDQLQMGLLNKCWLRFDGVHWPHDVDWIEWLGQEDGVWAQWVSLAQAAESPVLLGFHAGRQARAMEQLDDAAMVASAHTALKAIFGSAFPPPRAAQITRWSQDPFALGSYSFNAVGVTPKTRRDLAGADWDGRLVFAGEATSERYFGTAHGALLSGRQAAAMIEM